MLLDPTIRGTTPAPASTTGAWLTSDSKEAEDKPMPEITCRLWHSAKDTDAELDASSRPYKWPPLDEDTDEAIRGTEGGEGVASGARVETKGGCQGHSGARRGGGGEKGDAQAQFLTGYSFSGNMS